MAKSPLTNQSRAAGAPTPRSVAATAPMEGAHHGDGGSGFYSPDDGSAEAAVEPETPTAAYEERFTGTIRSGAVPLERGGTVDREIVEHMAEEAIDDPQALADEIARIRAFRKPIGGFSQKLALAKRPGYHRHWFNDTAGRIEEAKNNGWAHVTDKDKKPIQRCVGSGRDKGALYAFAMEIPEVFWLEDMATKHKVATEKMEGLKGSGAFRAPAGQSKAEDRGKFYDPSESEPIKMGSSLVRGI